MIRDKRATATLTMAQVDPDIANTSLLIVDDNEINRVLLERMLQNTGYQVRTARDGAEALSLLENHSFDLVLLDIMMPVLDGLSTLERMRENPRTRGVPVIMISAMSDNADVVRGLSLGANDYITKPIDLSVVLARVKTQVTLKRLMDERNRTITQLQESQQMRERFFQIASHDLKNPITNLKVAEALLREMIENPGDRVTSVLDMVKLTVDSMYEVIEEFLESAALQTGNVELELACHSASTLIQQSVLIQSGAAQRKDTSIQVEGDGMIFCDANRFKQVLANLLSNAIKYSPKGSTIKVWTEKRRENIRVFVGDQGPGIPEAERTKLFQPFGRLSTEPTGGESSHGLGLWIARHLIQLQKGRIEVYCPAEGGSVFWIELPECTPEV